MSILLSGLTDPLVPSAKIANGTAIRANFKGRMCAGTSMGAVAAMKVTDLVLGDDDVDPFWNGQEAPSA